MNLSGFVITLLVVSTLATGLFLVMNEGDKTYGIQPDTTLNNTFIRTEELQNTTEQVRSSVFGSDIESNTAEDSLFKAAFKSAKIVGLSFGIFSGLITDVFKILPLPKEFATLIIVGTLVALLFVILSLVVRFQI